MPPEEAVAGNDALNRNIPFTEITAVLPGKNRRTDKTISNSISSHYDEFPKSMKNTV
ncbi:MAG: hypothetical protein KQH63_11325 [Desulfobulbaceae bacterium]|nr:hypothetical protein [Desulfobulbaceae bacterium]